MDGVAFDVARILPEPLRERQRRRAARAGSRVVLGGLILGTLAGCVTLKAYKELEFAKREEEAARRVAETSLGELQRRLNEQKPESELALKTRQELEDKVVTLEQAVARLERDNTDLLEKLPGGSPAVAFEFSADLRRELKLEANPRTGGLVLEHEVLFESTGAELKPEAKALLSNLARALNAGELRNREILVDGHTDSRPVKLTRELNPDNWVLGARRAHAVLMALAAAGVDEGRLILRSFGYTRPIAPERPDAPRNRRVEIVAGAKSR